ncbi:MAG: GMC family oxidoreductase N-terminal domain-containing protein [Alphaproteobacteria bacterium]|nr:GMC family oxidoreductase N-terminal domain-containing protein [Alphaproteobacteria bacterium]
MNNPSGFDYIVVGSGAGGGTLAARLAEAGRRVLLLEAGGDPHLLSGTNDDQPGVNRLPADYDVPAFHGFASENDAMRWDFFVRHYADQAMQVRDPKYVREYRGELVDGILYPRAGTLGGCTAHNAMILVYPHNADWDGIAELTGDRSWTAEAMREYFIRLENCEYRKVERILARFGPNPSRHGWNGWLHSEISVPPAALGDFDLVQTLLHSAGEAFAELGNPLGSLIGLAEAKGDPNDWRLVAENAVGVRYTPLTTRQHHRMGARERALETAQNYPERLHIELDALVTRVILDGEHRASGVEYLKGARLYRAHGQPATGPGVAMQAMATGEVILCGGAFNTPQLLMLSGIGPRDVLEPLGIPVRIELPGVGKNLQDRYEVGVVNRMNFDRWEILNGATFGRGDPQYREWAAGREGVYASNGAVLAAILKSRPERPLPDLFCFALLGLFGGYFPGYSSLEVTKPNYLTWAILKAHTRNRAGEVRLRSADPQDTPLIDFRYFEEGSDSAGEDLDSVVAGIRFARRLTKELRERGLIAAEEQPGEALQSDAELKDFVRTHAWGHHASCTCPIGPREAGGVLGSDFRVHGAQRLRVVDASVFPRIPGFFIASAVYMIAEKAADVILAG